MNYEVLARLTTAPRALSMNETRRTHLEAIPPVPAILGAIVSVQAGAALAKGLFPALGPIGTVGLRVLLSAIMLLAVFRPACADAAGEAGGSRLTFDIRWKASSENLRAQFPLGAHSKNEALNGNAAVDMTASSGSYTVERDPTRISRRLYHVGGYCCEPLAIPVVHGR